MHTTIPRPLPKSLSTIVKRDCKKTPEENQTHIQHNRRHKPIFLNPRSDELRKSISPHVLVDCDGHEDRTGDGFVAINAVGG